MIKNVRWKGGHLEIRKKIEREFHDFSYSEENRQHLSKYYAINKLTDEKYLSTILGDCKQKRVLEYGCGYDGGDAFVLQRHGAYVIGIDISPFAIQKANKIAKKKDVCKNVFFVACDAENLKFPDDYFDLVVGRGILHHLDIDRAAKEICRVLKPNGKAIFLEPLGYNPLIALFRFLTPQLRTPDEHPLMRKDIETIKFYFHCMKLEFKCLFLLLSLFLRNKTSFEKTLELLDKFDNFIFRIFPISKFLAWHVIILGINPKKN
jgi:SAM-dependent methyltransferase